jgi:hypothetical protein
MSCKKGKFQNHKLRCFFITLKKSKSKQLKQLNMKLAVILFAVIATCFADVEVRVAHAVPDAPNVDV